MIRQTLDRNDPVLHEYKEMLKKEDHHDHNIVMDELGTLRWQVHPDISKAVSDIGVNELMDLFRALGFGLNSEIVRKIYRSRGYALSGYWELFYWEVNNPKASEYRQKV